MKSFKKYFVWILAGSISLFTIEFSKNLYLHFFHYKYDDGFAVRIPDGNKGIDGTWEYIFDSSSNGTDKQTIYKFEINSDSTGKIVYDQYVYVLGNKIAEPYSWGTLLGKQSLLKNSSRSYNIKVQKNYFKYSDSNLRISYHQINDSMKIDFHPDFDGRGLYNYNDDGTVAFINFANSRKPSIKEIIPLFNRF